MIKSHHNPHLDGLRGIAIVLVIGYHYLTGFHVLDFGWSGVDLFFVLSGYLLSGRLYPYLSDGNLLKKFYRNRCLRIVPLYYGFLILFFILWFNFGSQQTIKSYPLYAQNIPGFFCFVSNWVFIFNYTQPNIHLNHLWSLAVEEQFYIVFPLMVIFIREKKKLLLTGIGLIALVFISRLLYFFRLPEDQYLKIYWNSFFHSDAFLTGFVLYMIAQNGGGIVLKKYSKSIAVIATIVITAGIIASGTARVNAFFVAGGLLAVAVFFACLVFFAEEKEHNFLKKITRSRVLQQAGKISYGLYIFHLPLFLAGFSVINFIAHKLHVTLSQPALQLWTGAAALIATVVISTLSFRYYESFFLKWKARPVRTMADLKNAAE